MISAVDLLKGIGLSAGLESLFVEGMTGYLDTNFRGKADKALAFLAEKDLVYVHVEAPDEASHEGSLEKKIQAIEAFDREVVGPVLRGLKRFEDYSLVDRDRSFYTHSGHDPYPGTGAFCHSCDPKINAVLSGEGVFPRDRLMRGRFPF